MEVEGVFSETTTWIFEVLHPGPEESPEDGVEALFSVTGEGSSMAVSWGGEHSGGTLVVDGVYVWRVRGSDDAGNAMSPISGTVVVDRVPPGLGDIGIERRARGRRLLLSTSVDGAAIVRAVVLRGRVVIRKLKTREVTEASDLSWVWDQRDRKDRRQSHGEYKIRITATDPAKNKTRLLKVFRLV
ncbi:MAG TPA: hypothetical protein VNC78_02690 [Actinomycetota bacterium]|nr:hypothetical protein [Actinomycetota bacterium]